MNEKDKKSLRESISNTSEETNVLVVTRRSPARRKVRLSSGDGDEVGRNKHTGGDRGYKGYI